MDMDITKIKEFHGHMCPGLAIGIRVAEKAIEEMGERPGDEEVVALVETDNCAVDAIQFVTGCTFGKGNLILLDYGKNAFRFYRRRDGKAIRILVRPVDDREIDPNDQEVMKRIRSGKGTPLDFQRSDELRRNRIEQILSAPLEDLIEVQNIKMEIPERARIYNSVACDCCGEKTMEVRLRLLEGKKYCPECFEKALQA